ncbi:hypothetical protein [Streptomyces prunicolor]|uniref:hypothetical protein n=1 Tax=Streptomyces prunicolor TaxID=67348 RepID=UPI00036B0CA8|nr:hypothetical protein [Streptomyces prunicolor]
MPSTPAQAIWRFADHDTVRTGEGLTWHRGLRRSLQWAVPGGDTSCEIDDNAVRGLLAADPRAVFAPAGPGAYTPLPGHALDTPGALRLLDIRPATGATLHRHLLDRVGAFAGNTTGSRRTPAPGLRPADIRASLLGTAERHRAARITLDRAHGRVHARYAIASTLHTHTYVLTTT